MNKKVLIFLDVLTLKGWRYHMRTFIKVTFVTVLILAIMPWPAQAQVSRTGSLEGRVTDTDGLPLPGVTVTINSEALIRADLAAQTGQNGRYRFLSLPPGLYQTRFELAAFQTVMHENIFEHAMRLSTTRSL